MTAFYLYDDARARRFEPFASTRPMGELRVAARLIRERWAAALDGTAAGFVAGDRLREFAELDAPPSADGELPAGCWLVNARFAPLLTAASDDAPVLRGGDRVAAIRLAAPLPVDRLRDGSLTLDELAGPEPEHESVDGWWIDEPWDLVRDLEPRLRDDLQRLTARRETRVPDQCAVLGHHGVYLAPDAVVEPFVTFDCTTAPVVIERGATVQSFTRVQGPTWIGPHAVVGGDKVTACAIGDHCKVHGEVATTVFVGHANKAHDGFVGHSYLGRWVNLGADTVTSNLKNTYGPVALWTLDGVRTTDLQFLGTLFGDHAKTGIGMTLTTGAVIGAGAQIYGAQMPPKAVPPFAWGDEAPYDVFAVDKFLEVAERVMARRKVALSEGMRAVLRRAHADRWSVDA